jgi:hypothetical protein
MPQTNTPVESFLDVDMPARKTPPVPEKASDIWLLLHKIE